MTQPELFEMPEQDPRYQNKNPMVRAHGFGPEGTRCKTCRFIYSRTFAKKYYKCKFRGDTRGEGTDHQCNWDSCLYYEQVQCQHCWDKKQIRDGFYRPKDLGAHAKLTPIYKPCPECQSDKGDLGG